MSSVQWVLQNAIFDTPQNDQAPSIVADSAGNSYLVYTTQGQVSGAGNTWSGATDIAIVKIDTSGNVVWIKQQATFNSSFDEIEPSIALDSVNGALYIAYCTAGKLGQTLSGGYDLAIIKFDLNGNLLWVQQQTIFNTNYNELFPQVAVDSLGNLIIVYCTFGTVSGGTLTGSPDVVVMKMSPSGTVIWIKQNSAWNSIGSNLYPSVAIDTNNGICVAYQTNGTVSGQSNVGQTDVVLFKLDTNGNLLWIRQNSSFDTNLIDQLVTISTDQTNNVYLTYDTKGTVSGQTHTATSYDIVIAKFDSNGNLIWIQQQPSFNVSVDNQLPVIHLDTETPASLYVVDQQKNVASGAGSNYNIAVIKMDLNGNLQWVQQLSTFNTLRDDLSPRLAINGHDLYVTYYTTGSSSGNTNQGQSDIVVFKIHQFAPDLSLTYTGQITPPVPPIVTAGDTLIYTYTVTNTGDYTLYPINLTDTLGFSFTGLASSPQHQSWFKRRHIR